MVAAQGGIINCPEPDLLGVFDTIVTRKPDSVTCKLCITL